MATRLLLLAVLSSATALTVLFDESIGFNNYGACYEGDEKYVTDCLMQSHFAGYLLMRKPTKAKGSCKDFGYKKVRNHHVWDKAEMYWSKSKAKGMSFKEWNSTFYSKHPLLDEEYLRDGNPSCNGGFVQDRSSAKLSPHDGHFLSIYDDIPVEDMTIRVCIDGTAAFMLECAMPSDPFPYILMKNPRVTEEPCATVHGGNYEYVQPDHRCPGYNQSWWHSKPYVAGESFLPFRDNHSLLTHFVEYNVAKNPTCQTAFCNSPNLETAECNKSTPQWKTYNPLVPFPDRSINPEPKELPVTPVKGKGQKKRGTSKSRKGKGQKKRGKAKAKGQKKRGKAKAKGQKKREKGKQGKQSRKQVKKKTSQFAVTAL